MLSRTPSVPWWLLAGMAILLAGSAIALTLLLHLQHRPYLVPMIGVLVSAMYGGLGAGLLCAVTSLVLAEYLVIAPRGTSGLTSLTVVYELVAFSVTAALISGLAARRRRTQLTLEATLASIGDAVVVTDREGCITFLNSIAETLTGWTLASATGQSIDRVFSIINEETRSLIESPITRALREREIVGLSGHTILIARDGTERPISDSAAPIKDHTGRIVGAVVVFRDATADRLAEESLRRQALERQELLERERNARSESERANRLKDEFLATLSHELRTPLNAVLGWSHMLTRRELTREQQNQALDAIHRNAQAQTRLVDDILDLSRIVTGRMALGAEPVDVSDIVRMTAESFTPALMGKRQDLRLDLDGEAWVTGDPHRFRQIVWNLLSNATKFTPERGIISCRVTKAGPQVELTVSDTGQGIDPAFLPFMFDRFRQEDSSTTRMHGGLGLGLSLVRYLVEAHGGTVHATSPGPGYGATVTVRFPARATTDANAVAPASGPGTGDRV